MTTLHFRRRPIRIQPTDPRARAAVRAGARELADALFAPRTRLPIVDWVEQHVQLPPGSPIPGPFRFSETPYLRDILTTMMLPTVSYGAVVKAQQVGFSVGALCNLIGYICATAPESIALMMPGETEAERFSKEKIRALIENVPAVAAAFPPPRARDADNTILLKRMRAGTMLSLMGSNSTAATRSFTAAVLLFDEIDDYKESEEQGDPILLLRRAQNRFPVGRKKTLVGSTPTVWLDAADGDEATREERGTGSRAFREFLNGDRRVWESTCPSCGRRFVLDFFQHVQWPEHGTIEERARAAYYVCPEGCYIPRELQRRLVGQDGWVATRPGAPYPSWDISGLVSFAPDQQIDKLALDFLLAGKDPGKLKPFYNLRLGTVWKEKRTPIVVQALRDRREPYAAEVPRPVGLLTCAVDVQRAQGNERLEVLIVGWGAGEESWRIHHYRLAGDVRTRIARPGEPPTPWQRLAELLKRVYVHEAGVGLRITRTAIDSGDGELTDVVYKFCEAHAKLGVFAVKGEKDFKGIVAPSSSPLLRPGKPGGDTAARLVLLNTFGLKDRLFGRLKLTEPGPGAMHWPMLEHVSPEFPPDYFAQFKNESKEPRRVNKHSIEVVEQYVKTGPNEAIDLEVYSMAALYDCGADTIARIPALVREIAARGAAARSGAPLPTKPAPARRVVSEGFHRPR